MANEKQGGTVVRKVETAEILPKRLTKTEARKRTDKVKADVTKLWLELYALHQEGAHQALEYESFGHFVEAEFGMTRVHGYRLVKAAKVMAALGGNPGVIGVGERHMRELLPLANKPDVVLREFWEQLIVDHPKPTVVQVREAVQARLDESTENDDDAVDEGEALNGMLKDEAKMAGAKAKVTNTEEEPRAEDSALGVHYRALSNLVRVTDSERVAAQLVEAVAALARDVGSRNALEKLKGLASV